VTLENMREGMQEAEVLVFLSAAVEKSADTLGPDLTGRCRQVFRDRLADYRENRRWPDWGGQLFHLNHYHWQEANRHAFDLAAEVARTLGVK